jgi:hypothetical protein
MRQILSTLDVALCQFASVLLNSNQKVVAFVYYINWLVIDICTLFILQPPFTINRCLFFSFEEHSHNVSRGHDNITVMVKNITVMGKNITVMVKNITDINTTSNNISPQTMIHRIDHTTYTEWNTGPDLRQAQTMVNF